MNGLSNAAFFLIAQPQRGKIWQPSASHWERDEKNPKALKGRNTLAWLFRLVGAYLKSCPPSGAMHRAFTVRPVGIEVRHCFNTSAILLRTILGIVFLYCDVQAQERVLRVSVVDLQDKPIELVQLTTTVKSTTEVTNSDGKATIKLLETTPINSEVGLRITGAPKDYVFISPWDKRVIVPSAVTIVLAERGVRQLLEDPRALKALASNIIRDDVPGSSSGESPELRREAAIMEVARQFELPKDEIIRAIQAWGEKAKDPYDKAQADFIAQNYAKASAGFAEARRLRKAAREKAISEEFDACFSHGQSLYAEGKYRESVEAFQAASELRNDDVTMNNLAVALAEAGRYVEAESLNKRSLAIKEKALGADHPSVAVTLNNLAELYLVQGKYVEAESLNKRSLAITEKALGADHPEVAATLNNLASLYEVQGNYIEAEPLYKRSLAIREKTLGAYHPEVAKTLSNLATLYQAQGKYIEAEPLYKRSLALTEKALGADHPEVAAKLNNFAELYREQGKYIEAEPLYKRSLAITEKALGADHPSVAVTLNNLATLYEAQGKYIEAEPLYKRSLAIEEKALGADHPEVAKTFNNLAGLYESQGKYAEAEPIYKRSLAIMEKALGADHPEVAKTLNNLAALYEVQGKYIKAEPLYKHSLAITEKALGADHPLVAVLFNNLAGLYKAQGKYVEAEPLYKHAIVIYEKAHGEEHPDLIRMLRNYADLLLKLNRAVEAAKLEDRAAKIKAKNK